MTRMGDREICSTSRRLTDNTGELAYMKKEACNLGIMAN